MIRTLLLVGAGGFLGSIGRYLISYIFLSRNYQQLFPYPTLIANLVGCFLIGILIGWSVKLTKEQLVFLVTGFCGGFTTFSSFSMENITLIQKGELKLAAVYTLTSIVVGLALTAGGYFLAKQVVRS